MRKIWIMAAVVPLLGLYLVATVPLVADVLTSELGRKLLIPAAAALELTGLQARVPGRWSMQQSPAARACMCTKHRSSLP